MKKFLLSLVAVFICSTAVSFAQMSKEEAFDEARLKKIQKFVKKAPKETGSASADEFLTSVYKSGLACIANSESLKSIYEGMEAGGGVAAVLPEAMPLLTNETKFVKELVDAGKAGTEVAKKVKDEVKNPMAAVKVAKQLTDAVNALKLMTDETTIQVKAIESIVALAKE